MGSRGAGRELWGEAGLKDCCFLSWQRRWLRCGERSHIVWEIGEGGKTPEAGVDKRMGISRGRVQWRKEEHCSPLARGQELPWRGGGGTSSCHLPTRPSPLTRKELSFQWNFRNQDYEPARGRFSWTWDRARVQIQVALGKGNQPALLLLASQPTPTGQEMEKVLWKQKPHFCSSTLSQGEKSFAAGAGKGP